MERTFEIINDIKCYSPKLAFSNDGFYADSFELMYELESKNFWYISRNKIVQHLFAKYLGPETNSSVLEIGCGTGYVIQGLSRFKNYKLAGAEIYLEGLKFAKKRLPDVEFMQMDASDMPFVEEYDAIGAFDVLEHIENDELVMSNIYKSLKKGGCFFVTVPQYMFMWSDTDEIDCHKRRYSKKEILTKLNKCGFKVNYCTSFVFTLFPFMLISRFIKQDVKRRKKTLTVKEGYSELAMSPVLNYIFLKLMLIDEWLIKMGISLPYGGSLVLVAKKQ